MKIVMDARWIFATPSGVGIYTRELIRQLARLDTENEYVLLFDNPSVRDRTRAETGFGMAPNFRAEHVPYGIFNPAGQVRLPMLLSRLRADVFHSPNYMIPLPGFPRRKAGRTRCVVTIHDLIPMVLRDHAPRSKKSRLYPVYRRLMLEVGARADRIITVSGASRRDVIEHLALRDPDKVITVYNGVSPLFTPGDAEPASSSTVLYVGRLDPYKNVVMLVEAVAQLKKAGHGNLRLRLVGAPDPRYPEAEQKAKALGIDDAVTWSGPLSNEALRDAYRDAAVLVLPSRIEGFGLPVAEAMACGTPVVCSNTSALPEVAGDAAVLFDPDEPDALFRALERVLGDEALARALREKGPVQAARFTWEKAARETLGVYGV